MASVRMPPGATRDQALQQLCGHSKEETLTGDD